MVTENPVIILVKPQLAMNVGMVARAMLNFGFINLRIVDPRDQDVLVNALPASSGATEVLEKAIIFNSLNEAVIDLNLVYATSARKRYMNKPVYSLGEAFDSNNKKAEPISSKVGILFGAEKSGLSNNDLNFANKLINIPTNVNFSSLNLAAAVLLVCYEWIRLVSSASYNSSKIKELSIPNKAKFKLAEFNKINHFFGFLEEALASKNFFADSSRKEIMTRNLRNIFLRNNLTNAELKTLYGMVKILADKRDEIVIDKGSL